MFNYIKAYLQVGIEKGLKCFCITKHSYYAQLRLKQEEVDDSKQ